MWSSMYSYLLDRPVPYFIIVAVIAVAAGFSGYWLGGIVLGS